MPTFRLRFLVSIAVYFGLTLRGGDRKWKSTYRKSVVDWIMGTNRDWAREFFHGHVVTVSSPMGWVTIVRDW